jgi:transcriptional regulator
MSTDQPPPERRQTLRDALYYELREGPRTVRELSVAVGASEKDLTGHLEHLARSIAGTGERLHVEAAHCLACGYRFEDRTRLTKPGRCPACKATRIALPRFSIAAG